MLNIPDSKHERIVIVGGGFAGFTLAKKLQNKPVQLVLLDKNNYHQFQPLFYQVAMAGLEPSSISFPLRKAFQNCENIVIRVAELQEVKTKEKRILTDQGEIYYDKLVLAMGTKTNFYGNQEIEEKAFSLKSVSESLYLRNSILQDFEKALMEEDYDARQKYIDVVIVGGGPTGVELAGALAEMKHYILPKEYKEIDYKEVDIHLIQAGDGLLKGMSTEAGETALKYLKKLGVNVILNKRVQAYNGHEVVINDGTTIPCSKVIWAAGVHCHKVQGLSEESYTRGNRLIVNGHLQLLTDSSIYVLGDQAYLSDNTYTHGHPQVAQVAIQQAKYLAKSWTKNLKNNFVYNDLGSMATIGRNKAVVDLPKMKFKGFFAWILWLFVHIRSLIGFKNKLFVLINWMWNYITYDQSLRLIIKPFKRK